MDSTTLLLISALGLSVDKAAIWAPALDAAAAEFDINTDKRFAGWLAQMAHESANFRYTAEIWGNTAAQKRYDTRTDLGNTPEADGDGFANRGAGPIQITGNRNLSACAHALNIPREEISDRLMNDPLTGARGAGWWWKENNMNPLADKCDIRGMSGKVNCGSATAKNINGLEDREAKYTAIMRFMNLHNTPKPLSKGRTFRGGKLVGTGIAIEAASTIAENQDVITVAESMATESSVLSEQAAGLWMQLQSLDWLGIGIMVGGVAWIFYARWDDRRNRYN